MGGFVQGATQARSPNDHGEQQAVFSQPEVELLISQAGQLS